METKNCYVCKQAKPLSEFTWTVRKDGRKPKRHAYCNPCRVQKHKDWVAANPDRYKRSQLKRRLTKYGITIEQYEAWMAEGCAICHTTERRLVIDHCHVQGAARGVLCSDCNTGLGMFAEDPDRLRAAALFVEEHHGITLDTGPGISS